MSMRARPERAPWVPWIWGVFLWICVPAALFFLGFKILGPNIGQVAPIKAEAEKIEGLVSARPDNPPAPVQSSDTPKGPKVDIVVERSSGRKRKTQSEDGQNPTTGRPRSNKKPTKSQTEESPTVPDHPIDEASGDAAMGGDLTRPGPTRHRKKSSDDAHVTKEGQGV